MTERQVRTRVGIFLVVSHIAILLLLVLLSLADGFTPPELTTSIALIVPVFAGSTTAIVKSFVDNRKQVADQSPAMDRPFVVIAFLLPGVFVGFLVLIIVLKAFNWGIADFEHFKGFLALGETGFAVYLGYVIQSLFAGKNEG